MGSSDTEAKLGHLIRLSRERCSSLYRLDEKTRHPVMRLQDSELSKRREEFLDAIGGFAPELDRGNLLPDKFRYCLLVSDPDGFVVEAYAPVGYERDFQVHGIGVGGFWDERSAGTNGIALAMHAGRVLSVIGPEHFHACFRDFSCTSAPLRDAQANLIGSLTLVGTATRRTAELAWCEQVLGMASARFQTRLFRNFHSGCMTARLFSRGPGGAGHFESIAACDERGTIVASLPLSNGTPAPAEHRDLFGRHLSELRDLTITVRGPARTLPARRVRLEASSAVLPRKFPGEGLARLAAQGGGMDLVVERARKLIAHRVPLLLCGEPAVGKAELVQHLLDDLELASSMGIRIDFASLPPESDLDEALTQARFMSEYPIEKVTPLLVLLNVNRLGDGQRQKLEAFLRWAEPTGGGVGGLAARPVLVFTADRGWRELLEGSELGESLLYRIGQSVLEVPPIRDRDLGAVLDDLIRAEFDGVELSESAQGALLDHDWPGNLREMRAVIREALICGNGTRVNLPDLPQRILSKPAAPESGKKSHALRDALDSTGWNVSRAARLLGKSRATVNRWIIEEGLRRPE
jgi:transcriptional regulator of acetoin/glycerol metabolism